MADRPGNTFGIIVRLGACGGLRYSPALDTLSCGRDHADVSRGAEGATRPESLRQKDRRIHQRLPTQPWVVSGERRAARLTHRRGSSSQVTGQRGDGLMAIALFYFKNRNHR